MSEEARGWFGEDFLALYLQFKRSEIKALQGLDNAEACERYQEVYGWDKVRAAGRDMRFLARFLSCIRTRRRMRSEVKRCLFLVCEAFLWGSPPQ
jgi:hypothetical protein